MVSIDTEGNVRTLLGDDGTHLVSSNMGKTNAVQNGTCQQFIIRQVAGCNFSGDGNLVIFDHTLHGHTAQLVMLQTVGDDGIGDLVADFIRVSA